MPSIHKRFKSPYWICEFRAADGRWLKRSTKLKDKRRAVEWCQSLQHAQDLIGAGSPPESQLRAIIGETMLRVGTGLTTPTVRSWFESWLSARAGTAAPITISKYRRGVASFLEHLGPRADSRLETITQADIVAYRDGLVEQGKTAATVNQHVLSIVGAGLSLAFKQGHIRHNPLAGLRPLKDVARKRKEAFTLDDVRKLLTVTEGDWRGAILAGFTTGARLSDVANLRWENIDLNVGVVSFHQRKTQAASDDATVVGLHPDFAAWLADRKDRTGPVFPLLAGRNTGGRAGVSAEFAAIMHKAGVESSAIREKQGRGRRVLAKSFHSFRHGAASHVFTGKIIEEAQKAVTGHSRGDTLRRYTHVDLQSIKAAAAMIPRIF